MFCSSFHNGVSLDEAKKTFITVLSHTDGFYGSKRLCALLCLMEGPRGRPARRTTRAQLVHRGWGAAYRGRAARRSREAKPWLAEAEPGACWSRRTRNLGQGSCRRCEARHGYRHYRHDARGAHPLGVRPPGHRAPPRQGAQPPEGWSLGAHSLPRHTSGRMGGVGGQGANHAIRQA